MNSLKGHISGIKVNGSMSVVTINLGPSVVLKSIVIDTPETVPYLREGRPVNLLFKETEVIIGTPGKLMISIQNQIPATVERIDNGELLTKLELQAVPGRIIAIIATAASQKMQLKKGKKVIAMIKLNEIMLSEC
ncbi:MAG: TOBE domain-containing protein [Eudoraea sp.]|nr:TOBE domain-containing protein [Eudoraea sp.]